MTQNMTYSTGQNRTKWLPNFESSSVVVPAHFRQTLKRCMVHRDKSNQALQVRLWSGSEELGFSSLIYLKMSKMANTVSGGVDIHQQRRLVCGKPSVACHREMKEGVEEECIPGEGSAPSRQWGCSFNLTY